ncbi:hypothetical protein CsSME_00026814 [Camellia sinensis var. sinensis]
MKKYGGLGICKARDQNLALLSKLGWKMLIGENSLWVDVLKNKYLGQQPFLIKKKGKSISYIWKGILNTRELLVQGVCWKLGKGNKVRIWKDWWCGDGAFELVVDTLTNQTTNCEHTTVESLLDTHGDWDLNHLQNSFPLPMVEAIVKLQPPRFIAREDTPRWIKSFDGEFSTSSVYDLIVDHHNQERDWGWIWKLKFPQKLKSFLWLVLHGKILTNKMRNLRGITSDPNCPYCANVEDREHLLWCCPKAIQIWCHVYNKEWYCSRLLLPWQDWIIQNMKGKNHNSYLFLISLWTIWKNRNKMVFE